MFHHDARTLAQFCQLKCATANETKRWRRSKSSRMAQQSCSLLTKLVYYFNETEVFLVIHQWWMECVKFRIELNSTKAWTLFKIAQLTRKLQGNIYINTQEKYRIANFLLFEWETIFEFLSRSIRRELIMEKQIKHIHITIEWTEREREKRTRCRKSRI